MPLMDMPLEELRAYLPAREEPADFDAFWRETLAEARRHDRAPEFTPYDACLTEIDVFDVRFPGFAGDPVAGWLLVPAHATTPLPCVVGFLGYGGGRGFPHEWLSWPAAGYAHLVMDTRGQGGSLQPGATGDPHGSAGASSPGMVTRGIEDPHAYYYRRVFTDAVRAVDAARAHPAVDPARVVVAGGSQGGGIALAAAALARDVRAALVNQPSLTHYRRALDVVEGNAYREIWTYLRTHREAGERVFRTLSYFDGVNFAARATAPALFSVALMDDICPPSTVFAAHNHWAGPKEIRVWPWNRHEGGGWFQDMEQLRFLRALLASA
ncbi:MULTISPECIES: acetylxylan esterase [Streptomyces]|uniref:acetylxylan esterase n=1 Tax=Streptomyces TaxID=1883 RepID=UPI0001B54F44|nr:MULTISPECIES: acetylxylan esterase [unclassified Streptomyces]EFL03745.1 acetyl xylan esterase [Streptomyces sp. SPB78]MDT0421097.1 acetylxylan esterase [Streptomyces sp. DSM 41859]